MSGKKVYAGGLRIGTRCETVDEFIEKFHRFCEGSMIFIPHAKRSVGADVAFSFDLKDNRTALCGIGVVLEQFTDTENRFARPGIVIELRQLQESSRPVFEQMSALQRSRRGTSREVRPTAPPPMDATSPVSPRKLTPIPSYRPRAVTAAIEIDAAIAIASAAAKSGGLPKRTLPSMQVAVPRSIPNVGRSNTLPFAGVVPTTAHVDAGPNLFDEATSPPPLPEAPSFGVEPAAESSLPAEAPLEPAAESSLPAEVDAARADAAIADAQSNVPVEHSNAPIAAAASPSPSERERSQDRRERFAVAARTFVRQARATSRRAADTLIQRWRQLTPRRRWVIGSAATAAAVTLLIVIVVVASRSPTSKPVPASQVVAIAMDRANAIAHPAIETTAEKKPAVKKKKRRPTKKRVASKPTTKKPTAKKAAKPIVKKPTR